MSRPIRALAERVILEKLTEPEGLLRLIQRHDPVFAIGIVLSIGEGALRECPDLRLGARVLYSQDVSAKFGDKHVVHPSAILVEVDEGVTVRELDPKWRGIGGQRIEVGRAR